MKRVLNRKLVFPIANLLATVQLVTGDFLTVDGDKAQEHLVFYKHQKAVQPEPLQEVAYAARSQQEAIATQGNTAAAA